jgi:hypothetical protein
MRASASAAALVVALLQASAARGANCTARIAVVQTGSDSGCGGGSLHGYPIYDDLLTCHGWLASDTTGRVHENSVRGMRCLAEGGFELVQFAGSLDCSGKGTVKQFFKRQCQRDIPPTLYSVAVDLDCCSAPETCVLRQPSVGRSGAELFLDGEQCDSQGDPAPTSGGPTTGAPPSDDGGPNLLAGLRGALGRCLGFLSARRALGRCLLRAPQQAEHDCRGRHGSPAALSIVTSVSSSTPRRMYVRLSSGPGAR